MEASEASAVIRNEAPEGRWLKIIVGLVTLVLLSPVIGMVIMFAVIPALPIVLALGFVLGPMNWIEDLEEEAEASEDGSPWVAPHRVAHAM